MEAICLFSRSMAAWIWGSDLVSTLGAATVGTLAAEDADDVRVEVDPGPPGTPVGVAPPKRLESTLAADWVLGLAPEALARTVFTGLGAGVGLQLAPMDDVVGAADPQPAMATSPYSE
jgi:hypothetical protein